MKKIILVKFGGSLITDKNKIDTAQMDVIKDLARQIKKSVDNIKISLLIATGAGGFGHPVADKFKDDLAKGLPEIKKSVKKINQIVVDSLNAVGVKAEAMEPSKISEYKNGNITSLLHDSIVSLLDKNIVPVFHADLVNDQTNGLSILSMDRFLIDTAIYLKNKGYEVEKVIFCGTTNGVLDDKNRTVRKIDRQSIDDVDKYFYDNKQIDTSGGMRGKVRESLRLTNVQIRGVIINGLEANNLYQAILGQEVDGTEF